MDDGHDIISELKEPTVALRRRIPDVWGGFSTMHAAAVQEGALSAKFKEIMALAIGVAKQCDGCIAYHSRAAARHEASLDEVAEGLGVAILMSGGPGTIYAARAWRSFIEFSQATSGGAETEPCTQSPASEDIHTH